MTTDGAKGTEDPSVTPEQLSTTRRAEQRAAADILGVSDIVHLDYPDGYLQPTLELRRDVTRQIRRFRPDLVITQNPQRRLDHNPFVGHPDHLATGEATLAAVYPAARDHLNFPELWTDEHLEPWKVRQVLLTGVEEPNLWLDVEETFETGMASILAHTSQVDPDDVEERMRERARLVGEPQGIGLAQAFLSILLDMTRRGGGGGGGFWGGSEPDLTRRPGSEGRTLRRIAGFFRPYRAAPRLHRRPDPVHGQHRRRQPDPAEARHRQPDRTARTSSLLWIQCGLMIVLPIITSALGVWQSYLSNVVGQRVMNDLRLALYRHLQWMPLRFFTETKTGEIQSRIANDVGGVQTVVTDTASSVLANVATVATTIIAMWILDWRLTVLSLGLLPVFAYITFRVGKVRRAVSTLTQRSMAEMSAITEESLSVSGILLSKTFGQQEASIERFRAESQRLGDLQVRGQMIGRWFFALIGTFFSIMPAFVYLLAGTLIIDGDTSVSIGTIVAFTTLQSRLFFPLGQLLNVQVEIQGALALFDRIFEYLEMPHEITNAPDAVELSPVERCAGRSASITSRSATRWRTASSE